MAALSTPIDSPTPRRFTAKTTTFAEDFVAAVNARRAQIKGRRAISFAAFLEAAGAELLEKSDDELLAVLAKHGASQRRWSR